MEKSINLLQIETNTTCNGKCSFCMHQHMTRKGAMPLHKIINLLFHLMPHAREVCPFGMQEPMLDPYLSQVLSNCKLYNPQALTSIYTNMSHYPEKHIKRIFRAGLLDNLFISFYGTTKEIYNQLQFPLDYEQTIKNIKRICKYKRQTRWNKPFIKLEMLVTLETFPHFKEFRKTWMPIVDDIGTFPVDGWRGNVPTYPSINREVFGPPNPHVPCVRLFEAMYIHFDGSVVPCCLDYNDDYVVGNVFDDWNIWWTSEKLAELRKLHEEGRWDEVPLCKNCNAYQYMYRPEWIDKWRNKLPLYAKSAINQ